MPNLFRSLLLSTAGLAIAACGSGGSSSGGSGSGGTNTDTIRPTVSFSPDSLTVEGRSTGSSTLTATDNVGVSSTSVTCDNGGSFSSNTFTAPDVDVDTTVICTATARDARGNTGTARLTVTVTPGTDITDPTLTVTIPTTSVSSGGTLDLTVSASDNRGAPTVNVECDNGGSWANGVFTAPTVTTQTTVTCTITAEDDAGNVVTETVALTIEPPDTTAPTVTFPGGNTLTVGSGQTANYVITITDNSGETIVPTVSCDNGGSWANGVFTAPAVTAETMTTCTVTAEDSNGNVVTETFTVTISAPTSGKVVISGTATFDFVPHNQSTLGLDYPNTFAKPIRGATIQMVSNTGAVLEAAVTDVAGNYSFEVDPNTTVRIRVLAEIVSTAAAKWDVKIVDDSNGNNLYAIQGGLTSSGSANSTRDLHANSGWGGTSYTGTRAAGPFAILDPIYTAVNKFAAIDTDIDFPPVLVGWFAGSSAGSFFSPSDVMITLLGNEDVDTDEYDHHVVVHEWGHYFEHQLSRSDSIGGQHTLGDRLDARVAFGEGFGYAIAAMVLDDPRVIDSGGTRQAGGFEIPVDRNTQTNEGWFNEGSVQSVLYDLYDADADGVDNVEAGLGPIYETLTSDDYVTSPYFTTIFLFSDEYRSQQSATSAGLDALLAGQDINGTGPNGAGESNGSNIQRALPVYKVLTAGGAAVQICSLDNAGSYNKLGNRSYLEFMPSATGNYTLSMSRSSGATQRDPDFVIYRSGTPIAGADSGDVDTETWTGQLVGGTKYVIDAYDWQNVGSQADSPGDSCFNFSVN